MISLNPDIAQQIGIDQGKAKISFTGKAVTSHGGMALISLALDHFHVREDLEEQTSDLDPGKHHQMSSLLEQLITLRMIGGQAISDTTLPSNFNQVATG